MKAFDGAAKAQKAVLKAVSFMQNDDLPWEDWNTRGMGIFNATLGSPAGRDAWFEFSRKSSKFTEKETAARRLQNPDKKIGVAIVLKGGKGAGKTIVADFLQKIFGVHFVRVSHERHFLGNFNVHFEHALLVNAEEAFWAGKKSAEGVLKDMITGDSIMIERKGVDSYQARNLLDVLITSNADWVVPVSHDERRYFVLEVSDEKVGDFDYFRELAAEMEGDGPAAMLAELLAEDLSGFEPRQVPSTDALWEQKIEGMKSEESFLYEIARTGRLLGMSPDHAISRERLHGYYTA
jgi:hypothetical protein